ncbi:MAG: GntR family transcriptional regulator, partial [Verrucomicrobiota bacterium]
MAKHERISQELRAEIASGKYGASGQLPSEAQLVERFGVSRPTVARALRDLQGEGLIHRRAGAGTFVLPREAEASGAEVLGLLVPERSTTEIFEAICGELGAFARVEGFGLLWGASPVPHVDRDSTPEHAREVCQQFVEKGVTGVFFAPLESVSDKDGTNQELLEVLRQAGIPVVLLDRDVTSFPKRSGCDLVSMDNFSAGFLLAEHLIRLGCQRLKFVTRPGTAPTVDARISGVREALVKYGLEAGDEFVARGDPTDVKFVRQLRAGAGCDGVLCANDLTAAELLKSLQSLRVVVPVDVRLAGFDDVRYATLLPVPLTTIHQPCREIAEVAFRAMRERIREPFLPA